MSRELKFRGWDTRQNVMYSADEMGQDQLTLSVDGRGFINVSGRSTKLSTFTTHIIPMQYTGLKDENEAEKDWCADDLLQPIDGSCRIGIIQYNPHHAAYEVCDPLGERICSLAAACCDGWEKVGNIHQNPELLGEQSG